MPYSVARDKSCPPARPWACKKTADGKVLGCHPSREAAQRQVRAIYANELTSARKK